MNDYAFGNLAKLYSRWEKLAPAGEYFGKAIALLTQFPGNRWANELKKEYEIACGVEVRRRP